MKVGKVVHNTEADRRGHPRMIVMTGCTLFSALRGRKKRTLFLARSWAVFRTKLNKGGIFFF